MDKDDSQYTLFWFMGVASACGLIALLATASTVLLSQPPAIEQEPLPVPVELLCYRSTH